MSAYATLREANNVRQAEWDTGGDIDLAYAGNELAGEVGEAIELQVEYWLSINEITTALADELGDVVICCDLIARRLDLDLNLVMDFVGVDDPNPRATNVAFLQMAAATGRACNIIKKLERERHGMVGSRATPDDLRYNLQQVVCWAFTISHHFEIDLLAMIATKFNATSVKYGLTTMMEVQ